MIPYDNFYASAEAALKGFNFFRRCNPEVWTAWRNTAPNGAVVQCKLFGKRTVQRVELLPADGSPSVNYGSLWDAKVANITALLRAALEEAYDD